MGEDQREFPRSAVAPAARILIDDQWQECRVLDLSVEGISLELAQGLPDGTPVTIELEHGEVLKKNQVQAEVLRCGDPSDGAGSGMSNVVLRLIEPNDEYLMDALAVVHGDGPKKDRRKPAYGKREDER